MDTCLFCNIVTGKIPSIKVYEDHDVLAFMDIKPVTQGHCLVIPKKHSENIFDIPDTDLHNVVSVTKKICQKVKDNLKADAIRLSQSNGRYAGQAIFHFHLHIIPRYKDDGVSMNETIGGKESQADLEELKKIALQLNSGQAEGSQ